MNAMLAAGGVFHLLFALFHLAFWRLFHWRDALAQLDFINRNIMQILNLCLTFVFAVVAWISFTHADTLVETALGRTLLAATALFWLFRAALQVIFFGVRNRVSMTLFLAFLLGATLYGVPAFGA